MKNFKQYLDEAGPVIDTITTAAVNCFGGTNGTALVTIENGTEVLESRWVKTTKGDTKFNFEITKFGFLGPKNHKIHVLHVFYSK